MNEGIGSDEKDEIVHSSLDQSREVRLRRVIYVIATMAFIFALLAVGSTVYAYQQKQQEAKRGLALAEQLAALCKDRDGGTTEQGARVCKTATKVIEKDGDPGATGAPGPEGQQGATGSQGIQGPRGVTGPTGPRGPYGPKGDDGNAGTSGSAGTDGAAGTDGSQGPAGPKGETGSPGPQGAPGPAGERGAPGADGAAGTSAYPFAFTFVVQDVLGPTTYHVSCTSPDQDCEVTS